MPVEKIVLLTGAGFTHNFGAPMARGMWAKILNRLPGGEADTVRQLLLDDIDYDFEEVYQQVIKGKGFSAEDKKCLAMAVRSVYEGLRITKNSSRRMSPSPDPTQIPQALDPARADRIPLRSGDPVRGAVRRIFWIVEHPQVFVLDDGRLAAAGISLLLRGRRVPVRGGAETPAATAAKGGMEEG